MARAISCGAGVPPAFLQSVETGKTAGETPAPREPASLLELDELHFADKIRPEKRGLTGFPAKGVGVTRVCSGRLKEIPVPIRSGREIFFQRRPRSVEATWWREPKSNSKSTNTAPIVIAESATLNAGQM
jgi:hypothetical protein